MSKRTMVTLSRKLSIYFDGKLMLKKKLLSLLLEINLWSGESGQGNRARPPPGLSGTTSCPREHCHLPLSIFVSNTRPNNATWISTAPFVPDNFNQNSLTTKQRKSNSQGRQEGEKQQLRGWQSASSQSVTLTTWKLSFTRKNVFLHSFSVWLADNFLKMAVGILPVVCYAAALPPELPAWLLLKQSRRSCRLTDRPGGHFNRFTLIKPNN